MGEQVLKNIAQPVSAYKIDFRGDAPTPLASVANLETTPIEQPEPITEKSGIASSSPNDKPSIAVLPFDNMSNDPKQEYFADGITEDIITCLSRLKFLNVIARNSVFAYKGKSPDISKVAEDFKAIYVVEGSIRKAGSRARINVQLIQGDSGGHLWADKFDKQAEDDFELQDAIIDTIFKGLSIALQEAQRIRSQTLPFEEMGAWDFAHRANFHFHRHQNEDFQESINFAEKALNLDPNNSVALAVKGAAGATANFLGIINSDDDYIGYVKKAVELNPSDALCHAFLGHVFTMRGDIQNGTISYHRALDLNPNLPFALMGLGWVTVFSDQYHEGRTILEKAIDITTKDPVTGRIYIAIAASYIGENNYPEALNWINQAVEMNAQFPAKLIKIILMNKTGSLDEANRLAEDFKREYPELSIDDWWRRWSGSNGVVGDKIGQGLAELGLLGL